MSPSPRRDASGVLVGMVPGPGRGWSTGSAEVADSRRRHWQPDRALDQDAVGDQSENGWRSVEGRLFVTEAGVGCRIDPRAKHRASRKPFQMGVGHIRLLGEVKWLHRPRQSASEMPVGVVPVPKGR